MEMGKQYTSGLPAPPQKGLQHIYQHATASQAAGGASQGLGETSLKL